MGGLSVGGTLAASAGLARMRTIFSLLHLIMNPMIELHGLIDAGCSSESYSLHQNDFVGWGPGCREERANGRGGVCTFKVSNGKAAKDFGNDVLSKSKEKVNRPSQCCMTETILL